MRFRITADYRVLHWMNQIAIEEEGQEEDEPPSSLPTNYFPDEDSDPESQIYDEDWDMAAPFIPVP